MIELQKLSKIKSILNKNIGFSLLFINSFLISSVLQIVTSSLSPLRSQIVPDNTLGKESSVVIPEQEINGVSSELIEGGGRRNNNLFHSFQQFNIDKGKGVYFANPSGVGNIFTRVTGNNVSNVFGTLGVLGNANLFLINPNGIIFGPNTKLDLKGSFVGSTANSINFSDGIEFSATNPQNSLLTVSIPIGLTFRANSGEIIIKGNGHNLQLVENSGVITENRNLGIEIKQNQTLALLSSKISIYGGNLTADSGTIELWSVIDGNIIINSDSGLISILNSKSIAQYGDINLTDSASIYVGGESSGGINLYSRNLNLTNGSAIVSLPEGDDRGGNLIINTLESLNLIGLSDQGFPSGIFSQTFDQGKAGDLTINAKNLTIHNGQISTNTFDQGKAGELKLSVVDSINLVGSGTSQGIITGISAEARGAGDGGNLTITTNNMKMQEVAQISTSTFAEGDGGKLTIKAKDLIEIDGFPTGLYSQTNFGGQGDSGSVVIEAKNVRITNGGLMSVVTQSSGSGGQLKIDTSDSIELIGQGANSTGILFPSWLLSTTYGIGDGGDIIINAQGNLIIRDGAEISASNVFKINDVTIIGGRGIPGSLELKANSIKLNNNGRITAESGGLGEGGNISLQATDRLELRNESQISATAGTEGGGGNGGNITIDSPFIIVPRAGNSDITANAFEGQGGNININTNGLFGIQFRDTQTPQSDITASSQFGRSGSVEISTPNVNANQGLVELVKNPVNPADLVAVNACSQGGKSEFIITGRGGLPPNPSAILSGDLVLIDFGFSNLTQKAEINSNSSTQGNNPAQGWKMLNDGEMILIANQPTEDLEQTGINNYKEGNFPEAIKVWQEAITDFSAQGDKLNQAKLLNNLAIAFQQVGQWENAINSLNGSQAILADESINVNLKLPIMAQSLNNQGYIELAKGDPEKALDSWQSATEIYAQINDQTGVTRSLINQAEALQSLGLNLQAEQILQKINENLQDQPNSLEKAIALQSYGDILRSLGQIAQSEKILQQSLLVASNNLSSNQINSIKLSLGNTYRVQKDPQQALKYYQEVSSEDSKSFLTLKIKTQLNQVNLLLQQQRLFALKTLLPEINSEIKKLPPSHYNVYVQINFANTLSKINKITDEYQYFDVIAILENALLQAREIGDKRGEAYALSYLGYEYEQQQKLDQAQQLTEEALTIIGEIQADDIAYLAQWQLAQILKAQGKKEEAITAYNLAFDTLQTLRNDLVTVNTEVQFSFRETVEPIYRELVALLLEDNPPQKNLIQARQIMESLQLAELDNFFQDSCSTAKPAQIDQIDSNTAVIYPIILSDRLDVILSLPQQPLIHYSSPLSENKIKSLVSRLQQSLFGNPINYGTFDTDYLKDAEILYQALIQPAQSQLQLNKVKNLTFVLDGVLRNIPMAILYDGEQYLLEKYSIALTPGLQILDPQPLKRRNLNVLTVGLSEARQNFNPLPNVPLELEQIGEELATKTLLNEQFTNINLEKELNNNYYPVLHLATHGQFSSNIEETFLLTWDGNLNAKDLDNLLRKQNSTDSEPLELLVLSACQTAAGDNRAALGLAGIAVRAGASSTLATLWLVDDRATTELMVKFYQELAETEETKAEALRKAQLSLLKDGQHQHPFYWSPFVLVGNWL